MGKLGRAKREMLSSQGNLFVFSRDLSNNKISSLSNSSFTNMSQLTTL